MLRGLFIGIDRYPAPINRLSCARADAVALKTLFQDNSEGEVVALLDGSATQAKILEALQNLAAAAEDDLVLVSFSGHGTEDHALVPVDANANDLDGTCISLDQLAVCLDAIPSKQLIVVLDCCFAGGFGGARVFAPTRSRSPIEDRQVVEQLARGDGRVVLAASGKGEPALETQKFGHGLFTYHLIEGLQGVGEFANEAMIPLMALFDYVTTSVVDSAKLLGEVQTPSIYGSFEGAPQLQRMMPGAAYAAAFPDRVRPPATADWSSLLPYGFSQEVIDRWSAAMPTLNDLQLKAINDFGVLDGKSLLVVAPTSSGKTMIGELAAVREAEAGSRAVMLLPMRALVNDKYDYMRNLYGDHLTVVRATGEYADQVGSIYSGQFDVALLTYEKFLNIITASPWVLRGISLVVVDEAQNISDPGRGASLEFLLTLLRSGHARGGAPQVVALSAVIGSTHGLERWLDAGLLKTDVRPVPLRESTIDSYGQATHLNPDGSQQSELFVTPAWVSGGQGSKQIVIPLVQRLVAEGKKVIIFREQKSETTGTAGYLSTSLDLPPAASVLALLPGGDLSTTSNALRQVLQGGVGIHNSDLSPVERQALESEFRIPDSDLRIIVATTTLAMGINTPTEAVVIAGLTHPGQTREPYLISEYKNMVGRTGRAGFAAAGESYIVATGDPAPQEAWSRYVQGRPEDVTSHFLDAATDPQTLILRSLVALGGSVQRDELLSLLENSFAIWQQIDQGGNGWDVARLQSDLKALLQAQLLDIEPTGLLTVTELGRFAGESGLEVRSVTQVSSLLRFASAGVPLSDRDLVMLAQVTTELDAVYFPTYLKARPEQARWPSTLLALGVQTGLVGNLHVGGGVPVARAKKAAAAFRFASATPMNAIEAELMQHMRDRSAAGAVRAVAGRTRDVIEAVATICQVRGLSLQSDEQVEQLGVRLEIGLPVESVEMAHKFGASLSRAQYLSLLTRGTLTLDQLRQMDDAELIGIVGQEGLELVRASLSEAN